MAPIDAVDRALRLALLLHQEGPLRVADVAEHLGVARSTAYRLLSSLVHRDFAEQDRDRRYRVGPAMRRLTDPEPVAVLRAVALPHLRVLVEATHETAQLTTRIGTRVRFVATVVCDQRRRVGDREGRTLPAHLASGGLASLAVLPPCEVDALYKGMSEPHPAALARLLSPVRQRGFALNNQATEPGITAIGRAIAVPGRPPGAVSLSVPTERFAQHRIKLWTDHLAATASGIEVAMATAIGGVRALSAQLRVRSTPAGADPLVDRGLGQRWVGRSADVAVCCAHRVAGTAGDRRRGVRRR